MKVAAAVPVKSFARAKRRLRSRFTPEQVEEILRALLLDVLDALREASSLQRVVVLTGDLDVARAAREAGAAVEFLDPDPGLNPALDHIADVLRRDGYDALLVVLGDLPLLRGEHIDTVVEAGIRTGLAGVPAADGGTALLCTAPPGRISARFGPESFDAHRAAARESGLELSEVHPSDALVSLDLDTPQDAERIARSPGRARTVAVLRGLLA